MKILFRTIIAASLFFVFSAAAPAGALEEFKGSDVYKSGMFENASLKSGGILLLGVSEKFTLLAKNSQKAAVKSAVEQWAELNSGRTCMVSVSGYGINCELWEIDKSGRAKLAEEWGPGAKAETGSDFFLSGNLLGNAGAVSLNFYAGTYFFKNILDASVSLNVMENSVSLGVLGRGHLFVSESFDLNGGLQLSSGGSLDNMELSLLLGASNFIGHKTSLDFTCSFSTSGRVALGAGITYHEKAGSANVPFDITPAVKKQVKKAEAYYNEPSPAYTDTPANTPVYTATATNTPTAVNTATATYTVFVPAYTPSAVNTPAAARQKKETEEEMKERIKKEVIEELKKEQAIKEPRAKTETEEERDGFYMETDTLAIARIIEGNHAQKDFDIKMGWGDCGLFGISTWLDFIQYNDEGLDGMFWGVKLAADFYPLWQVNPSFTSPAGLYVGPVLGGGYGRFNQYYGPGGGQGDEDGEAGEVFGFSMGCELGFRLSLGGFLIDAGAEYAHNIRMYAFDSLDSDDIIYRLQIGWMWSSCGGIK
ncbi:MAG TPA: hypothetical protein PLB12_05665 [Candidatus Goldiibacteriota bacterium]|nr:hypothetical protein [Candidatus Goldiibacteriota bacterium]HRQ43822.1 hypothetical protein [Candidatus Goldiibacteriota bacterium]